MYYLRLPLENPRRRPGHEGLERRTLERVLKRAGRLGKMVIEQLRVFGFGIFGEPGKPFVAAFGPGLNLIVGSNEAGKSTLQTCLVWTLFGRPRSVANEYPPLRGGPHRAEVIVRASSGARYRVLRDFEAQATGKPSIFRETDQGEAEIGLREWEELLRSELGTSEYTVFERTACIVQGDVLAYCRDAGTADKKAYSRLKEVVEASVSGGPGERTVQAAQALLEARLDRLCKRGRQTKDRELELQQRRVAELRERYERAADAARLAKQQARRAAELSERIAALSAELETKRALLEHYDAWHEASTKAQELEQKLRRLDDELRRIAERSGELEDAAQELAQYPESAQALVCQRDEITELSVQLSDREAQLHEAQEELREAERRAQELSDAAQEAERKAEQARKLAELAELAHQAAHIRATRERLSEARREAAHAGALVAPEELAHARDAAQRSEVLKERLGGQESAARGARRQLSVALAIAAALLLGGLAAVLTGRALVGYGALAAGALVAVLAACVFLPSLRKTAGALRQTAQELNAAQSELNELLHRLKASSVAELEQRQAEQAEAQATLAALERELYRLARASDAAGVEQVLAELDRRAHALRAELGEAAQRIGERPSESDVRAAAEEQRKAAEQAAAAKTKAQAAVQELARAKERAAQLADSLAELQERCRRYLGETGAATLGELLETLEQIETLHRQRQAAEKALSDILRGRTQGEIEEEKQRLFIELGTYKAQADQARMRIDPAGTLDERQLAEHREQTERELRKLEEEIEGAREELWGAEHEAKRHSEEAQKLAPALEELSVEEQRLKLIEREVQSLELAQQVLEELAAEVEEEITAPVAQRAGEILRQLSGGRYCELSGEELLLEPVSPELGEPLSLDYLSYGTLDQLAFSVRYALAEVIAGGHPPLLILDDPFASYDDQRLSQALSFLRQAAEQSQILLFTHDKRYVEYLPRAQVIALD